MHHIREEDVSRIAGEGLERAQKIEAVGLLAGRVAHDFSNILTTIIGYSDMIMMESDLKGSVRRRIQEIKDSSLRAAALIQQLLAFDRKPDAMQLGERESGGVDRACTGCESILLVEDDETLGRLIISVMEKYGYKIFWAVDGPEALGIRENENNAVDLLITDVIMPGMGGKELADRLQARYPDLKVLYTSGYADDVIVHRGILEEGIAFLQKPFSPRSLALKTREVLDS